MEKSWKEEAYIALDAYERALVDLAMSRLDYHSKELNIEAEADPWYKDHLMKKRVRWSFLKQGYVINKPKGRKNG